MQNRTKGFLALLTAAIIFGSFGINARWLGQALGSYQQIAFRNVFGLIIGVIALLLSRQSMKTIKNAPGKFVFLYTFTFPLAVVFYTLSVLQTKVVTTIFGLYLGSLIISLALSLFAFKEKLTLTNGVCLLLTLTGLLIFIYPFSRANFGLGLGLGILSGFFDAFANGFRKYLAGKVDRFALVVLQTIGGIVIALILITLFQQLSFPKIPGFTWLIGIVWGAGLVGISYLTLVGFQNFDLNLGTVVLSSELFFGAIFAFVAFGERASLTELLGGIFIILASALANTDLVDRLFRKMP